MVVGIVRALLPTLPNEPTSLPSQSANAAVTESENPHGHLAHAEKQLENQRLARTRPRTPALARVLI
jgi:hypothetical protein